MAVANFGGRTDHFGFASADLILISSSSTPLPQTVERAENQEGDYEDEEEHGQNAAGDLSAATCTYALKGETLNLNTLAIGESASGVICESLEVVTANGAWPMITATGQTGTEAVVAPTEKLNTWTIGDSIIITGAKRAQLMDFAVDAGCRVTGSSYTASVDIASQANGLGVIVAHGVSGGVSTISADLVNITATCAWTPTASSAWLEEQAPGADEPQAGFETSGTVSASKILARDDSA